MGLRQSRRTALDPAAVHRKPDAGEAGGDVVRHRGGDQDLLRPRGHPRQRPAPPVVQLGEHVVEDQHRFDAVRTQQPVGASRSARASAHDSPWLAYPFAGPAPSRSSRSSRCGPTRHTPRSTSWRRTRASASSSSGSSSSRRGGQPPVQRRAVDERDRLRLTARPRRTPRRPARRGRRPGPGARPAAPHRAGRDGRPTRPGYGGPPRGGPGAVAGGLEQRRRAA